MAYKTEIPGLPGGPVTTNHPIKIKLIAKSNTYQRPGLPPAGQRIMVQHGTGNARSMAAGEATWLVDQRASGNQQSYHYITDDRETWVCLPINEHGWHAADGGGPGNMLGIANEMVENADLWASDARALQCIENTAEIMGITAARMNAAGPKQHWDFNYMLPPSLRHDCPNKLRYRRINGRLAWDIYVERYRFHQAAERNRMQGGGSGETLKVGDRVKATDNLNVRVGWGLKHKVATTVPAGTELTVIADGEGAVTRFYDGYDWVNVKGDFGTGWAAGEWLVKVAKPEPVPETKTFTTRYELPFRSEAGFNGRITRTLPIGTKGTILSGPVEKDKIGWYEVQIDGMGKGWLPASILHTLDIAA